MDAISELFGKKPPETLYHYTSQAGVLGIISKRSLRATSIHYMNDAREFAHAVEITLSILSLYEPASEEEAHLLEYLRGVLESIEQVNVHVFSLSENGDLLSQWRAYCPKGSGYVIGFDSEKLLPLMQRQDFFFAPCVYNRTDQGRIVSQLIDEVLRKFQAGMESDTPGEEDLFKKHCLSFVAQFLIVAPALKDPSFSEEREWRMISRPLSVKHPQMAHRQGTSMLIPHFEFSIGDSPKEIPIAEVIIGPTPHPELAKESLTSYLRNQGVPSKQVSHSRIPYREV